MNYEYGTLSTSGFARLSGIFALVHGEGQGRIMNGAYILERPNDAEAAGLELMPQSVIPAKAGLEELRSASMR